MKSKKRIAALDDQTGYSSWLQVVKTYTLCHRLLTERLADLGLSVAQHEVLLAVAREPGLSQKRLAQRLLVGKSNVTGLIKRLESRALVHREPDPSDGRGRKVLLTTTGRRLALRSTRVQGDVVRLMLCGLTETQIEAVDEVMRTVGASLSEALQAGRPAGK